MEFLFENKISTYICLDLYINRKYYDLNKICILRLKINSIFVLLIIK